MKINKIYLDMDGVLCDFFKEFNSQKWKNFEPEDRPRFRYLVYEANLFETLDKLPNTDKLLDFVASLNVEVEILTSVGTKRTVQGQLAKEQKLRWLKNNGINYKANFVTEKIEKSQYANESTLLIDDSIGCIKPFIQKGGYGILYKDEEIDIVIDKIKELLK